MNGVLVSADLVPLFVHQFRLCKVREGETVLIFTDPGFPQPACPPAAFSAAPYCGLAGQNASRAHYDICCRRASLWLDGAPVVDDGHLLVPADATG